MEVKDELVDLLRKITNAEISDCVEALEEGNGDISAAVQILFRKSLAGTEVKAKRKDNIVSQDNLMESKVHGHNNTISQNNEIIHKTKSNVTIGDNTMKKLRVLNSCIACGSCFAMTALLRENDEGKAEVVGNGIVANANDVTAVINICPVKAIVLEEEKAISKADIIKKIETLKGYSVPRPKASECPFDTKEYYVEIPWADGQHRYDYRSYSSAESAGKAEFERKMYSQREKIIRKIFTEYRVKYLRQYYEYEENQSNYYYRIVSDISKRLTDIANDIEAVTHHKVSDNLKCLELRPNVKDQYYAYQLTHFEDTWITDSAMNKLNDYKLSSYTSYFDVDDMETSDYGLFGKLKEVTRYAYTNMRGAFEELRNDIYFACDLAYDFDRINMYEPDKYAEDAETEIKTKCDALMRLIK